MQKRAKTGRSMKAAPATAGQLALFADGKRLLDMPLRKGPAPCSLEYGERSAFLRLSNLEKEIIWKLALPRIPVSKGALADIAESFNARGDRFTHAMAEPNTVATEFTEDAPPAMPIMGGSAEFGLQTEDEHEYFLSKAGITGIVRIKQREDGNWSAQVSKTNIPRVLSPEAVKAGLMPPAGHSALPKSLEAVIPEEYHYWKAAGDDARTIRDALVEADFLNDDCIKVVDDELKKVEVRYFVYEPGAAAAPKTARAKVAPATLGEKVAKLLPSDAEVLGNPLASEDWLEELDRLDTAGKVFVLSSPSESVSARELARAVSTIKADWLIECTDTAVARQELSVVGPMFKLAGEPDHLFAASFAPTSPDVDWDVFKAAEPCCSACAQRAKEVQLKPDPAPAETTKQLVVKVAKLGEPNDERFILGIVLEPDVVDAQDDTYSAAEVAQSAHGFMQEFRNVGLMHKQVVNDDVKILESYIAPADFQIGDQLVKKGTWLMAARVLSDDLWKRVKDGGLTGWSIGGSAIRLPVDPVT